MPAEAVRGIPKFAINQKKLCAFPPVAWIDQSHLICSTKRILRKSQNPEGSFSAHAVALRAFKTTIHLRFWSQPQVPNSRKEHKNGDQIRQKNLCFVQSPQETTQFYWQTRKKRPKIKSEELRCERHNFRNNGSFHFWKPTWKKLDKHPLNFD